MTRTILLQSWKWNIRIQIKEGYVLCEHKAQTANSVISFSPVPFTAFNPFIHTIPLLQFSTLLDTLLSML